MELYTTYESPHTAANFGCYPQPYPTHHHESTMNPIDGPFGEIDSILDEIANADIDDILLANNVDDLYNLLEQSDESYSSSSPSLSLSSSSNSSSGFDSPDYDSSSSFFSPCTNNTITIVAKEKKRRNRRCKHTKEERALRKKDQNKKAAIRYREKKKVQTETIENIVHQLQQQKNALTMQLKKIETEFNVILPLAQSTFRSDPIRGQQLQQLLVRLQQNNFHNIT